MNRPWLRQWLWVVGFCLVSVSIYAYFTNQKRSDLCKLLHQLESMESEKAVAMQEKEFLELQIASQKDPSWIEMILMRDLGVVPEGWLKVHFVAK